MKITQRIVREYVRRLGGTFRRSDWGDYVLRFGDSTYHSTDMLDIIGTARVMQHEHVSFWDAEEYLRMEGVSVPWGTGIHSHDDSAQGRPVMTYELFYGTGGHSGPYNTLEAAIERAYRLLLGSLSERTISVHVRTTDGVGGYSADPIARAWKARCNEEVLLFAQIGARVPTYLGSVDAIKTLPGMEVWQ